MKKILALVLVAFAVTALASCANSQRDAVKDFKEIEQFIADEVESQLETEGIDEVLQSEMDEKFDEFEEILEEME